MADVNYFNLLWQLMQSLPSALVNQGNSGIQTIIISPESLTKQTHSVGSTSSGATVFTMSPAGSQSIGHVSSGAPSSVAKSVPLFRIPEVSVLSSL